MNENTSEQMKKVHAPSQRPTPNGGAASPTPRVGATQACFCFCSRCGAMVATEFCPRCGNKICASCGDA